MFITNWMLKTGFDFWERYCLLRQAVIALYLSVTSLTLQPRKLTSEWFLMRNASNKKRWLFMIVILMIGIEWSWRRNGSRTAMTIGHGCSANCEGFSLWKLFSLNFIKLVFMPLRSLCLCAPQHCTYTPYFPALSSSEWPHCTQCCPFYCSYKNILLSCRCQRAAFYGKRDNLRRPEKIFRSCSLSVSSVCRSLDIFCLLARSWQKCRRSFLRLHRRLWLCIDPLFCSSLEIRREISLCVSLV